MASLLETIAPGFLVAAPNLRDPNFDHTVILMCVHGDDGAMGLVINRPAPVTLIDVLAQMRFDCQTDGTQAVMVGGPVAQDSGLLLYEVLPAVGARDDEMRVSETLRLCPNQDLLRSIGLGEGPERFHVFLGHAGWGPGQLERELSQGAWIPVSLSAELIFSTPVEHRWERALETDGLSPAQAGGFRPLN